MHAQESTTTVKVCFTRVVPAVVMDEHHLRTQISLHRKTHPLVILHLYTQCILLPLIHQLLYVSCVTGFVCIRSVTMNRLPLPRAFS